MILPIAPVQTLGVAPLVLALMALQSRLPAAVIARLHGLQLQVIDCGIAEDLPPHPKLQLRKVVEITGMLPHVDFLTQVSTTNDEGQAIKPDLVINMPDGKFVAVDAKAPFSNYQRATAIPEIASDQDNRQRIDFMKAHATDVKKRIDEIVNEMNIAHEELRKANKKLVNVTEFKFLRTASERENQIALAQEDISICQNNIEELEKEMRRINPKWGN